MDIAAAYDEALRRQFPAAEDRQTIGIGLMIFSNLLAYAISQCECQTAECVDPTDWMLGALLAGEQAVKGTT